MTTATVKEVNGHIVLSDPDALGMIRAVAKANCRSLFFLQSDRVQHFVERMTLRGLTPNDAAIVLINVDAPYGAPIADILMPGTDWQQFRDRGEVPLARGLATRNGMEDVIRVFDPEAADKLRSMREIAVVVVDQGVAEVFPAKLAFETAS